MEISRRRDPISTQPEKVSSPIATMLALLARKYRLTLIFAVSAALYILAVVVAVNLLVGNLAEDNLIRLAEKTTIREARHLQSMAERMLAMPDGQQSMAGMAPTDASSGPGELTGQPQPVPNTMDFLASPAGLPGIYEMLVEGLVVPRLSLLDLDGSVLWSSDPDVVGRVYPVAGLLDKAAVDGIASSFRRGVDLTDFDGIRRRIDVMEMYLSIPDAATGRIIGAIKADRDVTDAVTIQVEDAKWVVLWTTTTTMGLLFLLLLGFILVADVIIHRSRERELSIVEGANRELEIRVEQRTRELEKEVAFRQTAEQSLEKQAQELARSNRELEQFAHIASHDLQEPLRMVSSYTQLLQRRYKNKLDSVANEFIGYAVDGAKRMQTQINDLLAYSRVTTQGNSFEATNCSDIFETAVTNLTAVIEDSGAMVTRDPLPTLPADAAQLVSVFQNLIGNGIKYHGDQPPRIHVSAVESGDEWLFSFKDNGIGIEAAFAERIFVIFQRLHSKTKYGGTGIGLAICKKVVERHGGRIWVESEPQKGSTFYFTLQMRNQQEQNHGGPG